MAVLSSGPLLLREHSEAKIGDEWDARIPQIGKSEVRLLARMQRRVGREYLSLGHEAIRTNQWVGTLALGGKVVEVLPKLDAVQQSEEPRVRENLLHMLARAGLVRAGRADTVSMVASRKPLIAAFLDLYVQQLSIEWRRGRMRRYVSRTENRSYLRGRLEVVAQLRANAIQRQRFFTTADEFIENNVVSQLLKTALRLCVTQCIDPSVSRAAQSLWGDFEDVAEPKRSVADWQGVTVDRTLARFDQVVWLGKQIIAAHAPERDATGRPCFAMMFDMNEVFERYIAVELRAALGGSSLSVRRQISGKSLLLRGGKPQFSLRPDLGVYRAGDLVMVLDTKWKRLQAERRKENVSQTDMYQMYAYGKEYAVAETVVIYPRSQGNAQTVAVYTHPAPADTGAGARRIRISTVDVSLPLSERENVAEVRRTLRELAGAPVVQVATAECS